MDIRISDQLQYAGGLFVVLKLDLKVAVDIAEALDAGIFSDRDHAPGFNQLRFSASQLFKIIQFIIPPVF